MNCDWTATMRIVREWKVATRAYYKCEWKVINTKMMDKCKKIVAALRARIDEITRHAIDKNEITRSGMFCWLSALINQHSSHLLTWLDKSMWRGLYTPKLFWHDNGIRDTRGDAKNFHVSKCATMNKEMQFSTKKSFKDHEQLIWRQKENNWGFHIPRHKSQNSGVIPLQWSRSPGARMFQLIPGWMRVKLRRSKRYSSIRLALVSAVGQLVDREKKLH